MPDRVKEKLVELLQKADTYGCEECDKYDCCEECPAHAPNGCRYGFRADYLLAHGVTVQEWIPVSERLPRCGERVLIASGNAVFEAYLSISNKWVRCGIGWAENITHWSPLPEQPKKEEL